jgi:hypothetical protein
MDREVVASLGTLHFRFTTPFGLAQTLPSACIAGSVADAPAAEARGVRAVCNGPSHTNAVSYPSPSERRPHWH